MKGKDYKVCLLLGGNLNDVQSTFVRALDRISEFSIVLSESALYRTKAWGMGDDVPDFINQAIMVSTKLEPASLLQELQKIERDFGRVKKLEGVYESRIIDIDIIFFEDYIIKSEDLIVPHPRMQERNFVLYPMLDIAGDWVHPVFDKSIRQLVEESPDKLEVFRI